MEKQVALFRLLPLALMKDFFTIIMRLNDERKTLNRKTFYKKARMLYISTVY